MTAFRRIKPNGKPRRRNEQPEHKMQVALFKWAKLAANVDHRLNLLFAIPNGGHRDPRTAAQLKAEGVKSGVPDIFLPVSRAGYHGLWLELKAGKNKPTDQQTAWHKELTRQGYAVHVIHDEWTIAVQIIEDYLAGKLSAPACVLTTDH